MTTNRYRRRMALAGVALAAIFATTACPSNIHQTYDGFQGAVEKGATCDDLFDMRGRFSEVATLAKVDADLARIGCVSRDSVRTDR
jgi:hypothetical protein